MKTKAKKYEEPTFKTSFEADAELKQYGQNALSVFTLALYLRLDDIHDFAANAITEGPNDKKADMCYLDVNDKKAIIAQSYLSSIWTREAAPANKASGLNTAMAWLLSAGEDRIPASLKTFATDLRRALISGDINRVEIFYVHNCHESHNVQSELKAVADATRDKVRALIGEGETPAIIYKEFGLESIEELYKSRDSEILIDDWLEIPASDYVREKGTGWQAILTTVPGKWVQDLHKQHGDRLFSANYRDYLGSSKRSGNINYEITQTAESEPVNFWVYNNGITALTHEIKSGKSKKIRGISIINGAQTTGALSEASVGSTKKTRVPVRFVECRSRDLIDKIILYNNTQNEIKPADRRSKDQIQKKLRDDFGKYGIVYFHRRSSLRTPRNAITGTSVAPVLCAFHGEPQISYRNAKAIFGEDDIYERVFPRTICVEHVFLVRALSLAIDKIKSELNNKVSNETATQLEERQYEVLKYSASKHFIFYVVGALAEEIMNQKVSDLFEWKCIADVVSHDNISLQQAWTDVLQALLPQIATIVEQQGKDAFYDVPRSKELSNKVVQQLKALVASLKSVLSGQFGSIKKRSSI